MTVPARHAGVPLVDGRRREAVAARRRGDSAIGLRRQPGELLGDWHQGLARQAHRAAPARIVSCRSSSRSTASRCCRSRSSTPRPLPGCRSTIAIRSTVCSRRRRSTRSCRSSRPIRYSGVTASSASGDGRPSDRRHLRAVPALLRGARGARLGRARDRPPSAASSGRFSA